MVHQDCALSEVVGEILIIGLVVALAIVIMIIALGGLPFIAKSPYLATSISLQEMPGYSAIALHHRGGESVEFTDTGRYAYRVRVTISTPSGTFPVAVEPAVLAFVPGDTVFIYYNGTGYSLASSLDGIAAFPLPSPDTRVNLVDTESSLLIQQSGILGTVSSPATATTVVITPSPTSPVTTPPATTTATTSPTTTAITTTATTLTSTPSPAPWFTINVSWSPPGLGYVSESPPVRLANPATVTVAPGSGRTFYFVPNHDKAVKTIRLGGTTVYSGSSKGATITYTVNNIMASTTLSATFG